LHRGDSQWQFQISLYCNSYCLSPSTPSLPHLKQLQKISLFYFIKVYEVHQPFTLTLISFIHPLFPPPTLHLFYSPVKLDFIFRFFPENLTKLSPKCKSQRITFSSNYHYYNIIYNLIINQLFQLFARYYAKCFSSVVRFNAYTKHNY
jgi:hypothetical protein